jgi:hypothetical protein
MKKYFYLTTLCLFSLCTIYWLSHSPSEAQMVPQPQKPKEAAPADTLANWVKSEHSDPWKPLQFLKIEVSKPKPVKKWMVSEENNDTVYTSYAIYVTAPDLPPMEAEPDADPKHPGWKPTGRLPTKADITILQALYRPLPDEPWVSFNPNSNSKGINYSNIRWGFDQRGSHVPIWTRKGNVLRAEESVICPGGGQWKLKVRFRATVTDFFNDKQPSPLWAIEKTFWVESQMPHEGSVEYPLELHSSWINGLSYSHSNSGPWKPIPQQGQAGFPLSWAGDKELFIRAEKKYPAERWPNSSPLMPKVELLKDGKELTSVHLYHSFAYPGNYSVFRDGSIFTGLKELSRAAVLTPNMQLGESGSDQMLTIKASAGNSITAPLLLRRKPPEGIYNWATLQRVVIKWSIGNNTQQQPAQQKVYNLSLLPNKTGTLNFNTTTIRYPHEGIPEATYFNQVARVSLRDAKGKLLAAPEINKEGKYQFKIPSVGRYTLHLDVPGPDGKPLHRRADFMKTKLFSSDLSQKITLNIRETPTKPVPAGLVNISFDQWQPTSKKDVWQRKVTALTNEKMFDVKFAIRPWNGYMLHPQISWLVPLEEMNGERGVYQKTMMQYYRILPTLPNNASRQMSAYSVEATATEIDGNSYDFAEVLR